MKMDNLNFKKNMTKDEVCLLIDLVTNVPVITSKETNAATNKLKEEAWVSLAAEFNSKNIYIPRNLMQLKLKWDNLKKAARKHSQQIRFNLKSGGSKPDFITADEILDKVSALLGHSSGDTFEETLTVNKRRIEDERAAKHLHSIPKRVKPLHACTGKGMNTAVRERNLAIARYYEKKTEKLNLEIELLKCQVRSSKCDCTSSTPGSPIRWDHDDDKD